MNELLMVINTFSGKEVLTNYERRTYKYLLRLLNKHCELHLDILTRGLDELNKPEDGGSQSAFDFKSYRSNN